MKKYIKIIILSSEFVPLFAAVNRGSLEAVKLLLEKGAKEDKHLISKETRGFSALSLVEDRVSEWMDDKEILALLKAD
jgi:hypothetical protein